MVNLQIVCSTQFWVCTTQSADCANSQTAQNVYTYNTLCPWYVLIHYSMFVQLYWWQPDRFIDRVIFHSINLYSKLSQTTGSATFWPFLGLSQAIVVRTSPCWQPTMTASAYGLPLSLSSKKSVCLYTYSRNAFILYLILPSPPACSADNGIRPIWLSFVSCDGSESSLSECSSSFTVGYTESCSHANDAALACNGKCS